MRRRLQQGSSQLVTGWIIAAFSTLLYLLTMDRSVSWWDCGEFISTSYLLQIGHPPGAPTYQLLAHIFTLLSFGNTMLVAPMSNALSSIAGGITVMLLYWIIARLIGGEGVKWGAVVGALCYLLCDTAWFSAVESEVYSLAMLFCSLEIWLILHWREKHNNRSLILIALLVGLGVGVHMMTLLAVPALLLIFIIDTIKFKIKFTSVIRLVLPIVFFFTLGLTTYAIIPIRAAANPPINEGNPSNKERFISYMERDQYAKAPIYPRMWRERDQEHYKDWTLGTNGIIGNVVYYVNYQLGFMYGRYIMYNFIGRENLKHHIIVLFIFPLLFGIYGMLRHRRENKADYWFVMLLFLFGGLILNIYLNHPCYEPRDRDYAYILSFFAFAIWIGFGAQAILEKKRLKKWISVILLILAPTLLFSGNLSDHNRSNCHSVHDISMNHLNSCDQNAILITYGDNDTFPLWYLQQVEGQRKDIEIHNINLTGFNRTMQIIENNIGNRPIYFSQYFYEKYRVLYEGTLRCEGFCWRFIPDGIGIDDKEPLKRHIRESIRWNIIVDEYICNISHNFIKTWMTNTDQAVSYSSK